MPDSRKDERFANNPFVTGEPYIVFYAGMPLVDEAGQALGTLCVLDTQEHTLTPFQRTALQQLAKQVVFLMGLKKENKMLRGIVSDLEQQTAAMKEEMKNLKSRISV